jgi:hypothetical protein
MSTSRESIPALQAVDRELAAARLRLDLAKAEWQAANLDLTRLEAAQVEAQQASTLATAAIAARAYLDETRRQSLESPISGVAPRAIGE